MLKCILVYMPQKLPLGFVKVTSNFCALKLNSNVIIGNENLVHKTLSLFYSLGTK